MKEIKYSIIIPHKNCPELLYRCVNRIPQKDDIQIIVVDDNSDKDKKPSIIRNDVEIILLDETQAKGAGRARNIGIRHALGEWLLFADSDDFFVDDFYEIISKYEKSTADLILFKANSVDSDTYESSNRHYGINLMIDECLNGMLDVRELSLSMEVPWSKMIKAKFVREYDIWFDEVLASNDTMFSTKVSCWANSIEVSNLIIYVVTTRKGSLWHTRKKPENYLSRMGVYVNRNKFLLNQGYTPIPLIVSFLALGFVDIKTNLKALRLIIKSGYMFTGLWNYLSNQFKKRL